MDKTIIVWESEVKKANEESIQWKNRFTESAKNCFDLKYEKFELEKELEDSTSKYVDLYLEFEEKKMEFERFKEKRMEFIETEKRFETLVAENNDLQKYRNMYNELNVEYEEKKMECDVIMGKLNAQALGRLNAQKVLEEYEVTCSRLKERVNSLEEEEKKWKQERTAYTEEGKVECPPGSSPSSPQGNFEDARGSGTPHLDYQSELSEGIKDEKNNICFDSMVDFGIADRQQPGVETNESSRETLILLKQGDIRTSSTCIIDISDDEVMEIYDSEEDGM